MKILILFKKKHYYIILFNFVFNLCIHVTFVILLGKTNKFTFDFKYYHRKMHIDVYYLERNSYVLNKKSLL